MEHFDGCGAAVKIYLKKFSKRIVSAVKPSQSPHPKSNFVNLTESMCFSLQLYNAPTLLPGEEELWGRCFRKLTLMIKLFMPDCCFFAK